jgi:hypothetical protein
VNVDDMIMVSVDDHLVEPPDMFEHHLPARWAERPEAPHVERRRDGSDVWVFNGQKIPNIGPRRSTASSPPPSTRCGPAAGTSTTASRT